jgi:hypothetical protein
MKFWGPKTQHQLVAPPQKLINPNGVALALSFLFSSPALLSPSLGATFLALGLPTPNMVGPNSKLDQRTLKVTPY